MGKQWIVLVLRRVVNNDSTNEMTYTPFGVFSSKEDAVAFCDKADFYNDDYYVHHKVLPIRQVK